MQIIRSFSGSAAVRTIAVYKILTVLALVGVLVVLHLLQPDLHPARRHISQYARGEYSDIFVVGVYAVSSGAILLAFGLRRVVNASSMRNLGVGLLAIYGVGGFFVGGFFTDGGTGGAHTTEGLIHAWSAVAAAVALISACFCLTLAFHHDPRWRRLVVPSWILLLTAGIAGFGLVVFTKSDIVGIIQRVCIAAILAWLSAVAVRVFQVAGHYETDPGTRYTR